MLEMTCVLKLLCRRCVHTLLDGRGRRLKFCGRRFRLHFEDVLVVGLSRGRLHGTALPNDMAKGQRLVEA